MITKTAKITRAAKTETRVCSVPYRLSVLFVAFVVYVTQKTGLPLHVHDYHSHVVIKLRLGLVDLFG